MDTQSATSGFDLQGTFSRLTEGTGPDRKMGQKPSAVTRRPRAGRRKPEPPPEDQEGRRVGGSLRFGHG